jgi:hypothetical protein
MKLGYVPVRIQRAGHVHAQVFVALMLFTYGCAFGQLARLDRSGRPVAATPAVVMIGSTIHPVLGDTLAMLA